MKEFWTDVTKHLTAPLDAAAVRQPPKGKYGEYVDALHVIREANRIFGHGGWSYEVKRLELSHRAIITKTWNGKEEQQLRVSYLCGVRVLVGGAYREGLAVGVGSGKPDNEGDIHESAVKEAETDALKRALRSFGNTFGLALYEKDKDAREIADKGAAERLKSEVGIACQSILRTATGQELLEVLQSINVNDHESVIVARVSAITDLVKGAPSVAVLDKIKKVFSRDWDAVKDEAEYRKEELEKENS
jgi:hypothetical protein